MTWLIRTGLLICATEEDSGIVSAKKHTLKGRKITTISKGQFLVLNKCF